MVLVPNNESFHVQATGTIVTKHLSAFQKKMDSVMLGGDSITLDLPAGAVDCPDATCRYNPSYDQFMGPNGAMCRSCRGKGKVYTHQQTVYKCNRRWANEPFAKPLHGGGQDTKGGRVQSKVVRVKTHIASFEHIMKATGATLDGEKIQLIEEPVKTGWNGQLFYVVSWWAIAGKKNG